MADPTLTVIIPAYNEVATISEILAAVQQAPYSKQVIVVDDGSTDGTADVVERWASVATAPIELLRHPVNRGKGAAIRTGLARSQGEVTLVQDADLEYDPDDYPKLVEPILAGKAQVVFGSRYLHPDNPLPWTPNRVCVHILNFLVRALFGLKTTDEATCYKAFQTDLLRDLDLECERFEFCPEVTAKVGRRGIELLEVPIRYCPRTHQEGKKIRWYDGVEAIATLIRWRLARLNRPSMVAPLKRERCSALTPSPARGNLS